MQMQNYFSSRIWHLLDWVPKDGSLSNYTQFSYVGIQDPPGCLYCNQDTNQKLNFLIRNQEITLAIQNEFMHKERLDANLRQFLFSLTLYFMITY